jgi:hypothetical protein
MEDLPSNDNHLLRCSNSTFNIGVPLRSLDGSLVPADIHSAILLIDVVFGQRIGRRSILDISRADVETRYWKLYQHQLNTTLLDMCELVLPPCQGHVIRPSGDTTPSFSGAP